MRDPSRISRICAEILEIWKESPDQRFCQLIENIVGCNRTTCIFSVEDDAFEVRMKLFREGIHNK